MGFWTGTAFPANRASHWVEHQEPAIWLLIFIYLCLVVICPGRITTVKHGLLPHWYRWNGIFQLFILIGVIPELLMVLANGWSESVCRTGSLYSGSFSGTMMWLFMWSKVLDLVETFLIISEGRRPLVLHVIHHSVSLIYVWHSYVQQHSIARWFVVANLLAHVVLYSYLSPQKFILNPCWLMVCAAQMFQLMFFLGVLFTAQRVLDRGDRCDVDPRRLPFDKIATAIFLILFADFYHGKYRHFRRKRDQEFLRESMRSHRDEFRTTRSQLAHRHGYIRTGITPSNGGYSC